MDFILMAVQRSGTNFLKSIINKHPDIHCYNEMFLDFQYQKEDYFYYYWLNLLKTKPEFIQFRKSKELINNYFQFLSNKNPKKQIGVDIKYDNYDTIHQLNSYIKSYKIPIIHLIRKNVLKTFISGYLLNIRNNTVPKENYKNCISFVENRKVKILPNRFLIKELEQRLLTIELYRKKFHRNAILEIFYEDFFPKGTQLSNTINQNIIDKITNFLKIKPISNALLKTGMKKKNAAQLSEIIINYNDIEKFLNGTKFNFTIHLDKRLKNSNLNKPKILSYDLLSNEELMKQMEKIKNEMTSQPGKIHELKNEFLVLRNQIISNLKK